MSTIRLGHAARAAWALGAIALLAAAVPRTPEGSLRSTGRIEGRVRDQAGAPIAGAQVIIVGTTINAQTDAAGRYVLAKVPAGVVTLRAAFVGYRPVQVINVRVGKGATTRQDFTLERSVVEIEELTVVDAAQPLVPREQVTTKQRVAGEFTDRLPADRVNQAVALQPGVVASASGNTVSVRGGGFVDLAGAAPPFNTEEYAHTADNRFLEAASNPLSTFGIDVDRASYANVRRFLVEGRLPPADAVRIEELVNYFSYDYPDPAGEHPFAVVTDVAPAPWAPEHRLVRIGLQGRRLETASLPPSNLVFLIDVSGSMTPANKLPLVKQAFRLLVGELRPQDRVAIVVYAGAAGLVLPSTPGSRKREILDAIERLEAGGSTAGGAGLQLAYDVAKAHFVPRGNNRVILATDGDFNVGPSSEGELVRMIEERRREGTYLTVLGFGVGNYKDARMEQLADKGNGNFAYVDNLLEARKVLVEEFGGTLFTIAKDVKLQVEFNPALVRAYRLIGYENRLLAKEDFNDDAKDAGDMGAGHSVTALYEIVPVGARSDVATGTVDALRYQPASHASAGTADAPRGGARAEWLTVKLRYKAPEGGASRLLAHPLPAADREREPAAPRGDFGWSAAVAAFGMLLRDSEHKGRASWDGVLALARASRGEDREGYRAEFIRLVETARTLSEARRVADRAD